MTVEDVTALLNVARENLELYADIPPVGVALEKIRTVLDEFQADVDQRKRDEEDD